MHGVMLWFFIFALQKAKTGGGGHLTKVQNDLTSQSHYLCLTARFHMLPHGVQELFALLVTSLTHFTEQQMKCSAFL